MLNVVRRYGREDEETLGLCFKKELTLDEVQLFPPTKETAPTRLQERLLNKLGKSAFPFHLSFPPNSPTSVSLHQGAEEGNGEPCGVEYFIRACMLEAGSGPGEDLSNVCMAIRKIQFAPTKQGRQPSTNVKKVRHILSLYQGAGKYFFQDFMFSEGEMELEATLDRQLYHHGDEVRCSFVVRNRSTKVVRKIRVSVVQHIDIAMFTGGHATALVMQLDIGDGCPIGPGSTMSREAVLLPGAKGLIRSGVRKEFDIDNIKCIFVVTPQPERLSVNC